MTLDLDILGPETLRAIEAHQKQLRISDLRSRHKRWLAKQQRVRAESGWNVERLKRYRSMGYGIPRLVELSGHSKQDVVDAVAGMRGKKYSVRAP